MMLLYLAAASCLLSISCLPTAGNSGDVLKVSMCCPDGQVLKLDLGRINKHGLLPKVVPKCVRPKWTRDINAEDNLDDATIQVIQPDASEKDMVLKKNGVMLPYCPMGLMVKSLPLNNSIRAGMNPTTVWPISQETISKPHENADNNIEQEDNNIEQEDNNYWRKQKLPYKWVLVDIYTHRTLPSDALATGTDGDEKVYSGRQENDSDNILGKVHNNEWYIGCCSSHDLRGERHLPSDTSFSVLCANPEAEVSWTEWGEYGNGTELPDNVVSGGNLNGGPQYVGRGIAQGELTPGMYVSSMNKLLAMRGGEVHYLTEFELLILRKEQEYILEENIVEEGSGFVEEYMKDTKSSPDERIHLTSVGQMSVPGTKHYPAVNKYEYGEFCMTGAYDNYLGPSDEAVALMCHPCESQVMCMGIMQLFTYISRNDVIEGDRKLVGPATTNNIVLAGDMNGDTVVTFGEFRAMVEKYVEIIFNTLDLNEDGFLDELQKADPIKNLSLRIVLVVLDEMFAFYDTNQDDVLSLNDLHFVDGQQYKRKTSLREYIGVSPISLPEPMYRLYTRLDSDKNEEISLEEATNFIKGIFYVIDQNEDCSINLEEVILTLKQSNMHEKFQVAVKLLGKYYITLLDFAVREFVNAADTDGDKKTSLQNIRTLKDPAVIESIFNVWDNMGQPNPDTIQFLLGQKGMKGDERQAFMEKWLQVLQEFVNINKFMAVPKDLCIME